jgi:4-hydroxyphenylpyruvate dioxygenase-like putative hemolysin
MTIPRLHHVVFCVRPENQDRAADFWRDLGMTFQEISLVEEGLRVLLDWSGGIEIIAPTEREGTETARFRTFLGDHGEGVCSVVVQTAEVDGPIRAAVRHGATVRYQQRRENGEDVLDEADLAPVFGMPVTLLATNRPD